MTLIRWERHRIAVETLESVAVYPVWVQIMHSFNKFDMLDTAGVIKATSGRYGAMTREGHFKTVIVLARGPAAWEQQPFWLTLAWHEGTLNLSVKASDSGGPWWNSLDFRGQEYIGSVLRSLQNWLDESGFRVIE